MNYKQILVITDKSQLVTAALNKQNKFMTILQSNVIYINIIKSVYCGIVA